jgi:serine/threonine protein kinase
LIANQLQTFFPGLDDDKRGSMISDVVKGKISDKKRSNIPSLYGSVADKRRTILHSESASTIVSNYTQNNYTQSTRNFDIPEEETGSLENKVTRWKKGMMIGQGAFGKVYHALDLDTGEMMAVKQVPFANTSINKKQIDALKSEINLLKNLDYANVVKYLGFEITDSEINVFLEYVSGGSISSVLALTGAFPQIYCQNFAAQILCGLDYLHKRNVIHRDIKGANILIDQYGIAKITDFGISKIHDKKVYDRQTRMSMQGSIYWMAPEVAKGTMGYSGKVDIWSLGCLVLEMLTGEHPWQGIGGSVIFHLGNGRAPPLEEHGLSQISQQFLKLCFSIDPENRPTAFELLHHDYTDVGVNNFEVDFPTWYLESKNNRDSSEDEEDEDYDEEDSGMERMTLTEGNHGYLQPSY